MLLREHEFAPELARFVAATRGLFNPISKLSGNLSAALAETRTAPAHAPQVPQAGAVTAPSDEVRP